MSRTVSVYLSLGSNISPRRKYVKNCISLLEKKFPYDFKTSPFYWTQPYSKKSQLSYVNCCVCFQTQYSAVEILRITQKVEKQLGRLRRQGKGESRTIDVDILLWGTEVLSLSDLIIPHYDISNRDFFLIPLLDLDATLINPLNGVDFKSELQKIPQVKRTYPRQIETLEF